MHIEGTGTYLRHTEVLVRFGWKIENTRPVSFDIKFTRQGFENACSTCVLKAEPGKLYIRRHKPGILFISLPIVSLFKLAIMM